MVRSEFEMMLARLGAFYERKLKPLDRAVEQWFERVKYIPGEALDWIEKRIKDDPGGWPKNITTAIKDLYLQWLDAHPEKRAQERKLECDECEEGLIHVRKISHRGQYYNFVFRCAKCRQSNLSGISFARIGDLLAEYERQPEEWKPRSRSTKQMLNGIGQPIPETRVYR